MPADRTRPATTWHETGLAQLARLELALLVESLDVLATDEDLELGAWELGQLVEQQHAVMPSVRESHLSSKALLPPAIAHMIT